MFTTTAHPQAGNLPTLVEVHPGAFERPRVQQAMRGLAASRPVVLMDERGPRIVDAEGQPHLLYEVADTEEVRTRRTPAKPRKLVGLTRDGQMMGP